MSYRTRERRQICVVRNVEILMGGPAAAGTTAGTAITTERMLREVVLALTHPRQHPAPAS